MSQTFGNNAVTTLTADQPLSGVGSNVAQVASSVAPPWPAMAQTTIKIDGELELVTGGLGTTTLTVVRGVEGTAPALHVNGSAVKQEMTVGGLLSLGDGFWPFLRPSGLPGAVQPARFVGGSNGAPTSGTFGVGDFTIDYLNVVLWLCTVAGSPGSFVAVGGTPAGTMSMFGGSTAPSGWLLCDGAAYSTAAYPNLFAAIAYAFGGAGASFNVPDLRDRIPLGASGTHALGSNGGAATSSVDTTHGHLTDGQGNHNHGVSTGTGIYVNSNSNVQTVSTSNTPPGHYHTATTAANGQHGHNVTNGGGGIGFSVLNPFVAITYIVKT